MNEQRFVEGFNIGCAEMGVNADVLVKAAGSGEMALKLIRALRGPEVVDAAKGMFSRSTALGQELPDLMMRTGNSLSGRSISNAATRSSGLLAPRDFGGFFSKGHSPGALLHSAVNSTDDLFKSKSIDELRALYAAAVRNLRSLGYRGQAAVQRLGADSGELIERMRTSLQAAPSKLPQPTAPTPARLKSVIRM